MNSALSGLVNGLLLSAPLTAAVWLTMRFLSKRGWNAATRYAVWWITLIAVVMLPLAFLPVTVLRFSDRPVLSPVQTGTDAGNAGSAGTAATPVEGMSDIAGSGPIETRSSRDLFPVQVRSGRWMEWFVVAWAAASALLLLRLVVSYVLLERRKARAERLPAQQARLQKWLALCGAGQRKVCIAVSSEIAAPIAAGPYRPLILIPERMMDQLDQSELDQIVLHEAAHLGRRDDYMLLLQRLIETLFVFHPLVRWIARRIDLEREIACDDCVIQATGSRLPYAFCLTRVMELSGGVLPSPVAAPTTERVSQLETRVEMLLDDARKTTTHVLRPRLAAAAAILFFMLWLAAKAPGPVLFATPTQARPDATVRIPVVVTDRLGRYVSGLEKEHFKVLEDGVEQLITEFSSDGHNEPLSVAVVYAIQSGSTGRGVLQQAISQFKKTSSELWLIYGSNGRLASTVRVDQSDIVLDETQAVPLLPGGIVSAAEAMKSAKSSRKVIVILSDGNGRIDSNLQDQIRVISNEAGARIYAVSMTPLEPARAGSQDEVTVPDLLDTIAASTGGAHFAGAAVSEVQDVLVKIDVEAQNTYLIGFVPGSIAKDEAYRRILVEIMPPRGIQSLNARSLPGYFPANR